jgi:hypothetical protein
VVLRAGPPLQEQPAPRIDQEDRDGAVELAGRLMRGQLGHLAEGAALLVDELDERLAPIVEAVAARKG